MDEEEEKKKFETEENDGKEKKRLNIEALCERLKMQSFSKRNKWCSMQDANLRPSDQMSRALSTRPWSLT